MRGVHHLGGLASAGASLKDSGSASTGPVAGGKRFWRLLINSTVSGDPQLEDVGFREVPGGAVLTDKILSERNERAFTDSFSTSYPARNAFDFGAGLTWSSRDVPSHIGWRFAQAVEVNEVTWRNVSPNLYSPTSVTVQSSEDGETWLDEWSVSSGLNNSAGASNTITRP